MTNTESAHGCLGVNGGIYKWLTLFLAVSSGALVFMLARSQMQLNRTRNDIRFARDLIESFDSYQQLAATGDLDKATYYLGKLLLPPGAARFDNVVADLVERERETAVKNVISRLRATTGKDFGDEPERWIEAMKGFKVGNDKP